MAKHATYLSKSDPISDFKTWPLYVAKLGRHAAAGTTETQTQVSTRDQFANSPYVCPKMAVKNEHLHEALRLPDHLALPNPLRHRAKP